MEASKIEELGGGLRLADARGETLDERRDYGTVDSGEAAWERSLRVQRYSYVFESAGETF